MTYRAVGAVGSSRWFTLWWHRSPSLPWLGGGWYWSEGNLLSSANCTLVRTIEYGAPSQGSCGAQPYEMLTPSAQLRPMGPQRWRAVWRRYVGEWMFDGWLWTDDYTVNELRRVLQSDQAYVQ